MRRLATWVTFISAIWLGYGVVQLGLTAAEAPAGADLPMLNTAPMAAAATDQTSAAPMPALFGTYRPPEPQPPAPVEAQPPTPPISSLGYSLRGVFASGDDSWAIVSHPTGEQILRVDDELTPGMVVARIDEAGLWVRTANGDELMGFDQQ